MLYKCHASWERRLSQKKERPWREDGGAAGTMVAAGTKMPLLGIVFKLFKVLLQNSASSERNKVLCDAVR